MQNFKNFLRHGKQARAANSPPTTNVQNVYAQPPRFEHNYGVSEPNVYEHKPLQAGAQYQADFSAAVLDNRNVAARAGDVAAHAAADHQKQQAAQVAGSKDLAAGFDPNIIERIVAEERQSKTKMPSYAGLERYTLLDKMGDGAFSNVYRARDNSGKFGEVAIKVVRKFEMNNTQVSAIPTPQRYPPVSLVIVKYDRSAKHLANVRGGLGRQRATSGVQEGAKDSRGARS